MFEFRRGRMVRRGRLASRARLKRRTPLRPAPLVASGLSELTRVTVLERDHYCCVACGRGGCLQPHHRTPVGRGGSSDGRVHAVVNLVSVCAPCHDGVHANPVLARQLGLLVVRGVDPHLVPVFTAVRGLVFLTADGWFADVADVEPDGLSGLMTAPDGGEMP